MLHEYRFVTDHAGIDLELIQRASGKLPKRFPLADTGVKSGNQVIDRVDVIDIGGQLDMFTTTVNQLARARIIGQANTRDAPGEKPRK